MIKQNYTVRKNTEAYTEKDIKNEIEECKQILVDLGYEDVKNKKYNIEIINTKNTLGQCHKYKNSMAYDYCIKLSKHVIKNASPETVHEVIIHEMIHSIDGCMNHGPKWKYAAEKVNNNYSFKKISRLSMDPEYEKKVIMPLHKMRHRVTCLGCGKSWEWEKEGKVVKAVKENRVKCQCGCREFKYEYLG